MRGEFLPVWPETWRHIWRPLAEHPAAPTDLFAELYRELVPAFADTPAPEDLSDAINSPERARASFLKTEDTAFRGERALVDFFERAYPVVEDLGADPLGNAYFLLVDAFLTKFSLRYDLRRPFSLHPTLSGVFAMLMAQVKEAARRDADLHPLFLDFEESIRDLRNGVSERDIKTCIHKQMNLLEALAKKCPGVTSNTLGQICDQLPAAWPHAKIKDALLGLYGFTCDYPGIRHAGTPANRIRRMETKDMIAVTVLLAGFVPYLSHGLDFDRIYLGQ
jgi:hypothetical protein